MHRSVSPSQQGRTGANTPFRPFSPHRRQARAPVARLAPPRRQARAPRRQARAPRREARAPRHQARAPRRQARPPSPASPASPASPRAGGSSSAGVRLRVVDGHASEVSRLSLRRRAPTPEIPGKRSPQRAARFDRGGRTPKRGASFRVWRKDDWAQVEVTDDSRSITGCPELFRERIHAAKQANSDTHHLTREGDPIGRHRVVTIGVGRQRAKMLGPTHFTG